MTKKKDIKQFGLVGKNIAYSFSRAHFTAKFDKEQKVDHQYVNYDIEDISAFESILSKPPVPSGLNVTIPYKKAVIPYLDKLSEEAEAIQAVNTVVWEGSGKIVGHNTDHYGFEKALLEKMENQPNSALILGTGGASGAIKFVLEKMGCTFQFVSRSPNKKQLSYDQLTKDLIQNTDLIVNTTPVGTYPDITVAPPIPYKFLDTRHFLFDLIYNPEQTRFLKEGKKRGAKTSNGYAMLVFQAEKSWELWNS